MKQWQTKYLEERKRREALDAELKKIEKRDIMSTDPVIMNGRSIFEDLIAEREIRYKEKL